MFLEYTKKKLINKSIVEYLQVKNLDIISISGAGGKTSSIKLLAKNLINYWNIALFYFYDII